MRYRTGPGEFRLEIGVEQAPVRTHATLVDLPGLVGGLDDVVVDAKRVGAGDEIAQHFGLLDAPRIGFLQIVAGARPAELADDDTLARIEAAQQVVGAYGVVHRGGTGATFPI